MRLALVPAAAAMLFCARPPTPVAQATVPIRHGAVQPVQTGPPRRLAASSLYSRRSRRLVQSYLRLKLLETREADLERARLVIERKLGIGALLNETPPPNAR